MTIIEVDCIRLLGKELAKHVLQCGYIGYMHITLLFAVILLKI